MVLLSRCGDHGSENSVESEVQADVYRGSKVGKRQRVG